MSKMLVMIIICLSVVAAVAPMAATAQDEPFKILMNGKCFECKFNKGRSASVTEVGKPQEFESDGKIITSSGEWAINDEIDKQFTPLTFRNIARGEDLTCTALISGNTGKVVEVKGLIGPGGITFIETMPMGGISVTTIFPEFGKSNRLIAVHSRHFNFFSRVVASQYYGSCKVITP